MMTASRLDTGFPPTSAAIVGLAGRSLNSSTTSGTSFKLVRKSPGTAFYCLQPLVVRKLDDGRYEVVDGQQRLTTTLVLLDHRKEIIELLGKQHFSIDYETRDSTFPFGD